MRRALITGITGQDGSYLAELLLAQGYEIHGTARSVPSARHANIRPLLSGECVRDGRVLVHVADLAAPVTLRQIVQQVQPQEIYHLASQTHVGQSLLDPVRTAEWNGLATLHLLEAARMLPCPPRFFHASSSEVFGRPAQAPQDETTPYAPVNPYGCSKAFASQLVDVYRHAHGLFACNGILYNHESPRRGEQFVTRKICQAAARIKLGKQRDLPLGDIKAKRDWGDARDYVRGMWLALQHDSPENYVFATGQLHSVEDVLETAFGVVGLHWRDHVRFDEHLVRAVEPIRLVGQPAKAERLLGWKRQHTFHQTLREMTEAELAMNGA